MARRLEPAQPPPGASRVAAAIEARKRRAKERQLLAGMLVLVSTEPKEDCQTFERRRELTMTDFFALKAKGHTVYVASDWQQW